ncbi:MAG: TolC family protein, partial [Saprospiraceae bacterium]|nr:TolC family protein [Saprospiraceae bacterium]
LAKTSVNNAESTLRQAQMHLNQVLNRPISERFKTEEVSLANNYIITNDPRLFDYINRPDVFDQFSDFMVEEGFRNLPELKQLDAVIDIQERSVLLNKRDLFLPTIGVRAGIDEVFYRGGAGTDLGDLGIPGVPTDPNTLTWSLGLNASLPLFTGQKRTAAVQKAQIDLSRVYTEKNHFSRQFEQRIRNALEESAASYTNIDLNFTAQEAARRNLDLVQDAYSQGLVSVIQLIDAQNATIQSEEAAANAIYEFVLDLIWLERSIGNFYTLSSEDQRNSYFERLAQFIQ